MNEKIFENDLASLAVSYRAICENDSFVGDWRSDINQAYSDAYNHDPNYTHIVRIEIQQNTSFRFVPQSDVES